MPAKKDWLPHARTEQLNMAKIGVFLHTASQRQIRHGPWCPIFSAVVP
jgi:hypothetical protein